MIWSERWDPEHLLRTESGKVKVGFVVQNLQGPEILKMKNFDEIRALRALVYIFRPCPGMRVERSHPLMAVDIACGDDSSFVSRIGQAIFLPDGVFAKFCSRRNSATW